MKGFDRMFKEEAHKLRVQPSHSAWKRVESRMETQRVWGKARISRILSYAAVITLVVAFSIATTYYLSKPELANRDAYTVTIVDLDAGTETGQTIFDVERVRSLSTIMLAYRRTDN